MFAVSRIVIGVAALAATVPALAVGLGPLRAKGVTDGPRKGFYLTVINPYPRSARFQLVGFETASDVATARVTIVPSQVDIGGGGQRKVLAVASGLEPGETYTFRVCAEQPPRGAEIIHARVCSTLSARRVARP